jgi:hypothetical protein
MKTISMRRDFYYRPARMAVVHYRAGETYHRVPEAAAEAIIAADAGDVVKPRRKAEDD